ncbi:TolC family protein [Flavobacterium akiainvivens]|nr:TolC family protein [Flavobacterium akiainvivens]
MKRLYYITLFLIIVVDAVYAQQVLTLQQCLESGLKNAPEFQLRQLDILSAEITHRSPALEYLPQVSLNGTHTYNIGSVIDPATNNRVSSSIQSDNFSLNASMPLLDFNIFTAARRNKIAALKAKADKQATEAEYALTLLDNYINVLYSQELLKIQLGQFENAKFNLNRITKEVELGSRPKSDLYDMQMSYSQEESTILQTQQLLYNQKLTLLQLMNDTAYKPEEVVLAGISAVAGLEEASVNQMLEKALGVAPAVQAATLNVEVAKKNVTLERNNYLPLLSAFYSYSSFYYLPLNQPGNGGVAPFFTQLNDNKNHYIGLQLSVPIFNGLKTRQKVQLAKTEQQKSVVMLEQQKIKLRQALEQEDAKKKQNTQLAQKFEEARTFAEKSFTTTQSKFSSGLVDAIVFTTSKNQLLTAEYNLLKANVSAAYAGIKLHFLQFNAFPQ